MRLLLIILGVLYALCPYDLFPDFFPGWGWIDDLALLGLLYWFLRNSRNRGQGWKPGRRAKQSFEQDGWQSRQQDRGANKGGKDPYDILGVRRGAPIDEVKKAYRELAAKYHPDKVSHLGEEFRALAEKRFKEINEAYQEILGRLGASH